MKSVNAIGNIASTLASLRKERNYTLKELSQKTGLSISYLSAIENGKKTPDLNVVDRICDALNASPFHVLFKAKMEAEVPLKNRRFMEDYKSIFKRMDKIAKELYNDDDDDDDNDNSVSNSTEKAKYTECHLEESLS